MTLLDHPKECRPAGGSLVCALGPFEVGESRTLTITERVDADTETGTHIPNCATTQTTSQERDVKDNASCTDSVVRAKPTPPPTPTPTKKPTKKPRPPKHGPVCRCSGPTPASTTA